MKVLVTGATGFIGSHTVAAVKAAGHDVKLFVRNPTRIEPALKPHGLSPGDFEHATGDVNDIQSVRRALEGCDAVIHAGSAYVFNLPFWKSSALMKTNVEGTANVLRTAHEMGLDPIVYVSTSWVILQSKPVVISEESPIGNPPDAYPQSKVRAELVARELQAAGAPVVTTYLGMTWGPHDPHWGETSNMVELTLKGRLRYTPDGNTPMCDVRDVAKLHAAVLKPGLGPRRYMAPSHSPLYTELIRLVGEAAGRDIKTSLIPPRALLWPARAMLLAQPVTPFRMPVPYAPIWYVTRSNMAAESRAQKELGIVPRPVEESVRDTVRWVASTGRLKASLFGKVPA